jgi:adenylate cyclase
MKAWFHYGTSGCDPQTTRRLVITNVLVTVIAANTLAYVVFFALYDFDALMIPILFLLPTASLFLLTPFLHHFNPYAGAVYNLSLWIIYALGFSYLFGSSSGLHFYFLSGATCATLIFGIRQNLLSIFSVVVGVAGFLFVAHYFTEPAPFVQVPDQFLSILYFTSIPWSFFIIFCIIYYASYEAHSAEEQLKKEHEYSERLLANMLPATIARQLKLHPERTIADTHDDVTILFADIVGFTPRASNHPVDVVVEFLNRLFTRFDLLAQKHGLEKIKTIGDAFMVAGGMPNDQPDHAARVAGMALDMMAEMHRLYEETGEKVELRIGIHTGPVIAGVIGTNKLFYDVWGDTVNTAARMESLCSIGEIQVTQETKERLDATFNFEQRGAMDVKGKGMLDVWYLKSRKRSVASA